jgi:hypothetical protein
VDGARWGPERLIRGTDGWQDLTFDLSPFAGQARMVQIEIHSNDWQREYAFFDYIRIDSKPAARDQQPAEEKQSEPEPEQTEEVVSVLKTVFSDTFDAENEGSGQINHSRFENWFVRSGEADLLGRGVGQAISDHGLYLELRGSGFLPGKLQSKGAFRLNPGTYRFEFDLAANPKGAKNSLIVTFGKLYDETFALEEKKSFETIRRRIDVPQATNASLIFRLKSRGAAGPLLDNIRIVAISQGSSQPKEPAPQKQSPPSEPPTPYLGVRIATQPDGTVRVVEVAPDSPAAKAGLLPEDIILEIDGASLEKEYVGTAGLTSILSKSSIDRPAMFIIRRGTKRLALWVKLEPKN